MELKLTQSSPQTPIFNPSSTLGEHFVQRWKVRIRRISWNVQDTISKKFTVHVLKEGGTLKSLSKLNVVPILEVNLGLEGKHLHIPSPGVQVSHFDGSKLTKTAASFGLHSRQWNQIFAAPTWPGHLQLAKTTGCLVVLIPLMAFCIRCIMAAFRNRAARNSRQQAANTAGMHDHRSNSLTWKTVLSDLRDPEIVNTEPEPESGCDQDCASVLQRELPAPNFPNTAE